MKTLILSCNTGAGHNSVAMALQEIYLAHGQPADIVDALSFLPPGWSKFSSDVHSYIYRKKPGVFRYGYHHAEMHRGQFKKGHTVRNLLNLGKVKLGKFILDHQYDRVICCHVFAGLMLTDAIRMYTLPVTTGIVETDYTVTPGTEKCMLDWHFVPSEAQKIELMGFGVPEHKIAVTGIPVRTQFQTVRSKEDSRTELGFATQDIGKKNILIACGSMGCGPMEKIMKRLSARQPADASFTVSVLCGSNQKLLKRLNSKYGSRQHIYIFGKVQNMSLLLDAADVYITKPGGISVTEAAQKELPMVLINAVGGCEKHNLDYFVKSGGAVTAGNSKELANSAVRICENDQLRREMTKVMGKLFSGNDRDKIYSLLSCM